MRERIPETEAMRIKKTTTMLNGKKFRSARKAISYCQEKNVGQAIKCFNWSLE